MEEPVKDKNLGTATPELYGLQQQTLVLEDQIGQVLMPGDEFVVPTEGKKITLGPGLKLLSTPSDSGKKERISVCKAGVLSKTKSNTYFIEYKARCYEKFKNDDIVAVIKNKAKGDYYTCEVGTRERAQLPKFAFEGATKRYRPDLLVGDSVYSKVVDLPKDFPMEITCVNSSSGKGGGMGQLKGGHIVQVPIHFIRTLRTPNKKTNLMYKIGQIVPFEMSAGSNGIVWVKAKNAVMTILVSQLLEVLATKNPDQHDSIIKKFRKAVCSL